MEETQLNKVVINYLGESLLLRWRQDMENCFPAAGRMLGVAALSVKGFDREIKATDIFSQLSCVDLE